MKLLQLGGDAGCGFYTYFLQFLSLQANETSHVNHPFSHLYNIFSRHVIFPCFSEYNDTLFLFVANWGKHWRRLLDPLLFFKCCLRECGYGVNKPR